MVAHFEKLWLGEWYDSCFMPKRIYEINEKELEDFIERQERTVERLNNEKPGSGEHRLEFSVLEDAKQLLVEKQRKPRAS